jgi:hypothetical protein
MGMNSGEVQYRIFSPGRTCFSALVPATLTRAPRTSSTRMESLVSIVSCDSPASVT